MRPSGRFSALPGLAAACLLLLGSRTVLQSSGSIRGSPFAPPFTLAGKSVYMVMIDRFAHPDANAAHCNGDDWCGGTLQGLTAQLDYIKSMHFDCIWITPVTEQYKGTMCMGADGWCGTGYHGYWTQNFESIDPAFGTADSLRALSDEIHARGMCLVYDMVINHVRPVESAADLAAVVPFNEPSHYNMLGSRGGESFDEWLRRPGTPPNAISTFGCCGCSVGDMQCPGAEGYDETVVERGQSVKHVVLVG